MMHWDRQCFEQTLPTTHSAAQTRVQGAREPPAYDLAVYLWHEQGLTYGKVNGIKVIMFLQSTRTCGGRYRYWGLAGLCFLQEG
jgi:hypothetical protein